ncbi:hypothetical protein L228DRAFT_241885 [Xylona heveae TC161]|uniref:DRBM domain-containing protein n=1 Tax=Xylona heveae (strain CBS 132557 / TC161) TaxID=1328760 RepID=A0A164ZKQ9_XYLHT|nr:hypothetical protein L228DRAFT_241885 [Xylona heveae TC161]KZF19216.1 hypothetical protein L228DRAFT_241885 [Xylona heveae TC161]
MYYMQYLSSLCHRRHWPDPLYGSYRTSAGYTCTVRVNNREYQTDTGYESEKLARENAAMRAYLICRNFSVNDGMYPAGYHNRGSSNGIIQGLPVAIGTGRRSTYSDDGAYEASVGSSNESVGSSRASSDSGRGGSSGSYEGNTVSRSSFFYERRV